MHTLTRAWIYASTLLLVAAPSAYSQRLSFGAKVGTPLTTPYTVEFVSNGGASAGEQRLTIGPTMEVHLPFHLSLEVDALWRQSSFSIIGANINSLHSSVNDWQVPVMAKYEGKLGPAHPFIDGGVVYRHVSTDSPQSPSNPSTAGVTIGGGVMLKLLRLRLSPELRYTKWPRPAFSSTYVGPVTSRTNQVDLLIGITF